ncbi:DHA2 family efflux MFS transporter permease subunit [Streptococcus ratti]|uniref:Drug-export protein n=1 Tax=Streptococcus ratti FA-1 = DSM 20564 TaxID=699248 RepID=A0ABN0GT29_STRRT|nr:DHA2 family efflux MFS transporter permease subunit [Streptococcus ratti]EJN93449.1 putative drug-export protein [Streptococcus ratti FA-1 = DSM 20564]EMP71666.1 drug-export protein, multidrug resistance protein [Streptococcus ratti FA-1 = DSM 20564]QEY07333.1 multidrug efflux MFS transporter [Streptococcus ratti]VEI59773.1 drug-export protein, multidrug resistance protein [Streptococcus mutans]
MTINHHTETVSPKTQLSIVATALLGFSGILSETSMNVTFTKLMSVFHLPLSSLQWITTVYLLAVAISMTLSATLQQNVKERHQFNIAVLLFLLGTLTCIASKNFTVMIAGRALQGAGTGIAMPLMFNLIIERVPISKIGTYMGIGGLIMGLAPAFGPTYGGFMIAHFSWQWIFLLILPVPVIAFFISHFALENSVKNQKRPFDLISFLLLAVTLSFFLILISGLESGSVNWLALLIFILACVLFVLRTLKSETPFLDIRILKQLPVILGLIPFFIYQFSNLASNFLIPNFLVQVEHVSTTAAGFVLLPGTLLGGLLAPLFGKLYDIKGPKLSLYTGNTLFAVSLFIFALWADSLTVMLMSLIYIIFTFGRNMSFNNTMAVAISQLPKNKTADATAIFQMMQQFAGALGTALSSVVLQLAPNMTAGVKTIFWGLFILVLFIFMCFKMLFASLKKN